MAIFVLIHVFKVTKLKKKVGDKMNIFGKDMVIGDFKLSDYGLMLGAFDLNDEEELGMDYETVEEFVGYNPVPVYLGAKYTNKLMPQATIVKDPCIDDNPYFTEHECREVLRQLTGFRGYKLMQILLEEPDELYYFNVRVQRASYRKVNGKVVGIILAMECDSQFAWSKEYEYTYHVSPDKNLIFVNISDDLNNYLLPHVTIIPNSNIANLEITNLTDNNWTSSIKNISSNEVITMDSKNQTLQSSKSGRIILNDFNLHFIRFVSGKNELSVNAECTIVLKFRVPRKVGFL